jgi:hypothetical protein
LVSPSASIHSFISTRIEIYRLAMRAASIAGINQKVETAG